MGQIKIPYGISDYKRIRTQNYIYVDKTNYIEKLENYPMTIFVRPRRFGKSLFTSMISYYYDLSEKDNFENLYKGLYIYDNPTDNKNSYYILKFNFSGMNISQNKTENEIEELFNKKVYSGCQDFIDKYELGIEIKENFNEKTLKYVYSLFLSLSKQYYVYGEFPAQQGFADIFVEKSQTSRATYEAVIELKYLSKEMAKKANYDMLKEEAINQLQRYMEDKRLNERENIKKFVIIFEGFDKYNVYENK